MLYFLQFHLIYYTAKMKDINDNITSPFLLKISFSKWLEHYNEQTTSRDNALRVRAKHVLKVADELPILTDGFTDFSKLDLYKTQISDVLADAFSSVLSENEIRAAAIPFHNIVFNTSKRFKTIIENAGDDFKLKLDNLTEKEKYIVACAIILNNCYQYNLNFKRPFIYEIPDKNGITHYYKVLYNADFVEIKPNEKAPKITDADIAELLDNYDNYDLWCEKFPPQSYDFKGFVISNLFDVTDDHAISNLKSILLSKSNTYNLWDINAVEEAFKSLLNVVDVKVGFLIYNKLTNTFNQIYGEQYQSYLLNGNSDRPCEEVLCDKSFDMLFKQKLFYSISDVELFNRLSKGTTPQYRNLKEQGFKSAILAPIANDQELFGILELVSKQHGALNSLNINKLNEVMPYILTVVERSLREEENLIEAVIQKECTAIHTSVKWKFAESARQFIKEKSESSELPTFNKIVFNDVYPLYGQIDVKGSSNARIIATQKDLKVQLKSALNVIIKAIKIKHLPVYEQINFQIKQFIIEIEENFKADSEYLISEFLKIDVNPLMRLIKQNKPMLKAEVDAYFKQLDPKIEVVYHYRWNYDETIRLINKNMSALLDEKQIKAQEMYPHFFERFKTDGVEHNMYIGESITREDNFSMIYLYNLRLWQLQVMCEMENFYYQNQKNYPMSLDVSSMVLVFSQPLSIRFRMDEKRFDVDGTYNARYEVVKKRIDKAFIKGTQDRITEKGKLTIVFSKKEDQVEYLGYIHFLQNKQLLDTDVEILELEDLQGVTGLKALRVSILYHLENDKKFYTYNDLIATIQD